jgi:hypothetical protein
MCAMLRIPGLAITLLLLAGSASAQWWPVPPWWTLPGRVRDLERTVAAQDARIDALEQQATVCNQGLADLGARVGAVEGQVASLASAVQPFSAYVDCDAGDTLRAALNRAQTAPSAWIQVSGTCREAVQILSDRVTIRGTPTATIEAPPDTGEAVLVRGLGTQLSDLTIRANSIALSVSQGGVMAWNLHTIGGGVDGRFGTSTQLFSSTIEGEVRAWEGSYVGLSDCTLSATRGLATVYVTGSEVDLFRCQIAVAPGWAVRAENGAQLRLSGVTVTSGSLGGLLVALGSSAELESGWNYGAPATPTRISGGPIGLAAAEGASVRLGGVEIEGNGDGIHIGDSSVVALEPYATPRVTGNSGWGVLCANAPAVPQLVDIDASHVFGNGTGDIACPVP